ncbi:MAG: hypothetical protein U0939_20920 [Pirellulales bacterium]
MTDAPQSPTLDPTAARPVRMPAPRARHWHMRHWRALRRGAATLDYVLVMGVVMPLVVFVYWAAPRAMNLVFELTSVVMGWPFQ